MPPLSKGFSLFYRAHTLSIALESSCTRRHLSRGDLFRVTDEVRDALDSGKPVVALETTVYTHGFPYPENVALSSELESLVRVNGGVPATIGVLNGVARVGMEAEELIELVSKAGRPDTRKISRRDLGFISGLGLTGQKINGGTTIAGTMILAHLAGIKIFATGGLGGVHRGGENSMDISADLTELGRTPVTVISSGCKSFLDTPRTLEYLETQGVGVGTFADGRDGPVDFPAFFARESGVKSPKVIKDEAEAAAIVFAQLRLPLQSGLLFANPVPLNQAMAKSEIDRAIDDALTLAEENGISGAENTPFILEKIKQLSHGKSVIANRALIEANVIRGTKVAVELAKLELREKGILQRATANSIPPQSSHNPANMQPPQINQESALASPSHDHQTVDIIVFGSLASDLICDYNPIADSLYSSTPVQYTSNPSIITQSIGGVGHNITLAASYTGASVLLSSVVADDLTGRSLLDLLEKSGMQTTGIVKVNSSRARTAQYVAVNDRNKDLLLAMADMAILQDQSLDLADQWSSLVSSKRPKWVVVDGNWSPSLLRQIVDLARRNQAQVAFEPVSVQKSMRLFHPDCRLITPDGVLPNHLISLATPNSFELETMHRTAREVFLFESPQWWEVINSFELSATGSRDKLSALTSPALVDQGVPQQTIQLLPYIPNLVIKLGAQGCLLAYLLPRGDGALTDPDAAPYILARCDRESGSVGGVYMRLFGPAEVVPQEDVVSVNGVGDTLLGVLMAGLVGKGEGKRLEDLIPIAQHAALKTLKSLWAVSPELEAAPKASGTASA